MTSSIVTVVYSYFASCITHVSQKVPFWTRSSLFLSLYTHLHTAWGKIKIIHINTSTIRMEKMKARVTKSGKIDTEPPLVDSRSPFSGHVTSRSSRQTSATGPDIYRWREGGMEDISDVYDNRFHVISLHFTWPRLIHVIPSPTTWHSRYETTTKRNLQHQI